MKKQRRMGRRWRAAILAAVGAGLILVSAGFWLVHDRGIRAADDLGPVVATINGEAIRELELGQTMVSLRAGVIDEFRRERGVSWTKEFWLTSHSGERPLDVLLDRAYDEVVRNRVILRLAEQHGLLDDGSYQGLLQAKEQENARRSADHQAGMPVYGPLTLDERRYADLRLGLITLALQEELANSELEITEEKLIGTYEAHKTKRFRQEDVVSYTWITAAYGQGNQRLAEENRRQLHSAMQEVREQLLNGEAPETLLKTDTLAKGVSARRMELDEGAARTLYKSMPELYHFVAETGQTGDVSEVTDDPQTGLYAVAVIHDRTPGGYLSYESQRDNVRKLLLQQAFEDYLETQIRMAKIERTPASEDTKRLLYYVNA
ncbi:hypothetical protein [Paenibacillus daejeonensis]|uniref:hypothetical protein n=1 Tax=Paenibacillus daejeonensis TaxID=135193 RepID=UPI0003821CF9|nr:hypothetical protein [Paenibacillus daejeonensis]